MRIFEIKWVNQGESEWVSGNTVIEALQKYCSITGMDIDDFDASDDVIEVPESKWEEYTVKQEEDEGGTITFKQWMKENERYGPDIIAGTMYEL